MGSSASAPTNPGRLVFGEPAVADRPAVKKNLPQQRRQQQQQWRRRRSCKFFLQRGGWRLWARRPPVALAGVGRRARSRPAVKRPELNRDPFYGINRNLYNHWENISVTSNSGDSCSSKRSNLVSNHHLRTNLISSQVFLHSDVLTSIRKHCISGGKEACSTFSVITQTIKELERLAKLSFAWKSSASFNKCKDEDMRCIFQGNVAYVDRFYEEFGSGDFEGEDEIGGSLKIQNSRKPLDFQTLFGGNNNDDFMMGIKFTKKPKNREMKNSHNFPLGCPENFMHFESKEKNKVRDRSTLGADAGHI
ncbi:hypothetical protein KSP40_PGU000623 [Platanthera guangdongensis]|uniref:UTP25 NTP hydrolase-like domain-containing protein n=1 Tax=Platanthera guangdongensis TaxID=2320717 RepID=A0ABR2MEU8_9ASPA